MFRYKIGLYRTKDQEQVRVQVQVQAQELFAERIDTICVQTSKELGSHRASGESESMVVSKD